jgi:murein L,D-transpeptidase YcbB/YkuD
VVYDAEGQAVDPGASTGLGNPENFPYTLRQPASDDNALGRVKFLFPNKYSIYLHDTPSRHLFAAADRTFSHGCIRLENPLELAENLLAGQDSWNAGKIQEVVASGETKNVAVEHPIPIIIVYWTVSVGASGEVRYAPDIYTLDPPLLAALDAPPRVV